MLLIAKLDEHRDMIIGFSNVEVVRSLKNVVYMHNGILRSHKREGVSILSCLVGLTLCDSMDCSLPGSSFHGISRQEYWSWLPFPSAGDLPDPEIEPLCPARQVYSFPLSHVKNPFPL